MSFVPPALNYSLGNFSAVACKRTTSSYHIEPGMRREPACSENPVAVDTQSYSARLNNSFMVCKSIRFRGWFLTEDDFQDLANLAIL